MMQNQAIPSLLFFYRYVLGCEVGNLGEVVFDRKNKNLPVSVVSGVRSPVEGLCEESYADPHHMPS